MGRELTVKLGAGELEARVLAPVRRWAGGRADVRAVLLVGSHARGAARADSDVDLVVLADDPRACLADPALPAALGGFARAAVEEWGRLTALRAFLADGLELDLGFSDPGWMAEPLDPGSRRVLADGARVIVDRLGGLEERVAAVRPP